MIEFHAASLAATHALAAQIARLAQPGDIIVLAGEMGTGKTAFAQGFGSALGVDEPITSPTFTLVHSYDAGKLTLHHADLYRLDRLAEVADLALDELAERRAVVLVEWGDVAAAMFPEPANPIFIRSSLMRGPYTGRRTGPHARTRKHNKKSAAYAADN